MLSDLLIRRKDILNLGGVLPRCYDYHYLRAYFSLDSLGWETNISTCLGGLRYGAMECCVEESQLGNYLRAGLALLPVHANIDSARGALGAGYRASCWHMTNLQPLLPCGTRGLVTGMLGALRPTHFGDAYGFALFTDKIALYRNSK